LKLVVLKIESPDLHRDQTFRTNLLSLGSLFIPSSRRSENQGSYRTGSGMYHPIVKEQAPLSCRKAYRQSESIATPCSTVKRSNAQVFHKRYEIAWAWRQQIPWQNPG